MSYCVPFIKKSTKSQQFQDFTFYVVERIDCTVGQPTDDLMMMMLLMLILEAMHSPIQCAWSTETRLLFHLSTSFFFRQNFNFSLSRLKFLWFQFCYTLRNWEFLRVFLSMNSETSTRNNNKHRLDIKLFFLLDAKKNFLLTFRCWLKHSATTRQFSWNVNFCCTSERIFIVNF